jgi:hypothetical protein
VPSRADVDQLVDANRAVRELIGRDLQELWDSLDLASPAAVRDAVLAYMPVLVAQYGDVTATVAADWYSEIRLQARAPGKFTPVMAKNMPAEFVERGARTALAGLFAGGAGEALDRLVNVAGKYAAQSGRDTIIQSASRDRWKPRVARVPSGPTTCSWCLMLASRGGVYTSLEKAGKFRKFHGHCDCQVVVIGKGSDLPEGYDPEALYIQYQDAQRAAKSEGITALQVLRRDSEADVSDAVAR